MGGPVLDGATTPGIGSASTVSLRNTAVGRHDAPSRGVQALQREGQAWQVRVRIAQEDWNHIRIPPHLARIVGSSVPGN
jgi:hypothetical protein